MIQRFFLSHRIRRSRWVSAGPRPESSTGRCNPRFAGTTGRPLQSLLLPEPEWGSLVLPICRPPSSTCVLHCRSFAPRSRHVTVPFFAGLFFSSSSSFYSPRVSGSSSLISSLLQSFRRRRRRRRRSRRKSLCFGLVTTKGRWRFGLNNEELGNCHLCCPLLRECHRRLSLVCRLLCPPPLSFFVFFIPFQIPISYLYIN